MEDIREVILDISTPSKNSALRQEIQEFCAAFPAGYWRRKDKERAYSDEFVSALTKAGYLSAMIPKVYGGLGLGVQEAGMILEEINRSGANSGAFHGQMYIMGALARHGSSEQKQRWLTDIAAGRSRLQAFSVTEPEAGSDTTSIKTFARKSGDEYIITGHKNWTSRIHHSDLMLLLARTGEPDETAGRSTDLNLFVVDLADAFSQGDALQTKPVNTMMNCEAYQVDYKELRVPSKNMVGLPGQGFRCVIDGWNAERILLASECIGDGYWFLQKARDYAWERVVFDRPIGQTRVYNSRWPNRMETYTPRT